MSQFPKITRSARSGETGVNLVAYIINNSFGWLFRRNHNETDFGIDGYIDIIEQDGSVTGRCLAVQIKYGTSYLKVKSDYGYTYYGELKHINYLGNHQIPVLIIICDPDSGICYWEKFGLNEIQETESGWKMTIPYNQTLDSLFAARFKEITGFPVDHTNQIKEFWSMNRLLGDESSFVSCVVDREEIESGDNSNVGWFFERIQVNKELARKMQGKVEIFILGYDDDQRELWEIPEIIEWFKNIEPSVKFWFFFLNLEYKPQGISLLACCLCGASWNDSTEAKRTGRGSVELSPELLANFLGRNFMWLNEISEQLNVSLDENKRISFAAARCLGLNLEG
jgi:hypothetical protein